MEKNCNRAEMKEVMWGLLRTAAYTNSTRANEPMVEMGSLVARVVSPEERISLSVADVHTPHGVCIAPQTAANLLYSIRDLNRPRKFIVGFYEAIQAVLKRRVKQVDALYIGTGPFATLALPPAAFFPSSRLVVHAVDRNQESLNCLDRVVRYFGVEDSFPSRLCVDATTVDWSKHLKKKPDIVVMECMSAALLGEPQAAIVENLVSQIGSDFLLVPQYTGVYVSANTPTRMGERQPFFMLDRRGISMRRGSYEPGSRLVTGVFRAPDGQEPENWTPILETAVNPFGKHVLMGSDSDITRTVSLQPLDATVEKARITYVLGGSKRGIQINPL